MNAYDTLARLSVPVPAGLLKEKGKGGQRITFVSWFDLCDLMDERAPGWCSDVRIVPGPDPTVIMRVTVPTDDGPITREATGTDDEPESNYGSPLDRAEASALRRVFAKFGLGRELYHGKGVDWRRAKRAADAEKAAASTQLPVSSLTGGGSGDSAAAAPTGERE